MLTRLPTEYHADLLTPGRDFLNKFHQTHPGLRLGFRVKAADLAQIFDELSAGKKPTLSIKGNKQYELVAANPQTAAALKADPNALGYKIGSVLEGMHPGARSVTDLQAKTHFTFIKEKGLSFTLQSKSFCVYDIGVNEEGNLQHNPGFDNHRRDLNDYFQYGLITIYGLHHELNTVLSATAENDLKNQSLKNLAYIFHSFSTHFARQKNFSMDTAIVLDEFFNTQDKALIERLTQAMLKKYPEAYASLEAVNQYFQLIATKAKLVIEQGDGLKQAQDAKQEQIDQLIGQLPRASTLESLMIAHAKEKELLVNREKRSEELFVADAKAQALELDKAKQEIEALKKQLAEQKIQIKAHENTIKNLKDRPKETRVKVESKAPQPVNEPKIEQIAVITSEEQPATAKPVEATQEKAPPTPEKIVYKNLKTMDEEGYLDVHAQAPLALYLLRGVSDPEYKVIFNDEALANLRKAIGKYPEEKLALLENASASLTKNPDERLPIEFKDNACRVIRMMEEPLSFSSAEEVISFFITLSLRYMPEMAERTEKIVAFEEYKRIQSLVEKLIDLLSTEFAKQMVSAKRLEMHQKRLGDFQSGMKENGAKIILHINDIAKYYNLILQHQSLFDAFGIHCMVSGNRIDLKNFAKEHAEKLNGFKADYLKIGKMGEDNFEEAAMRLFRIRVSVDTGAQMYSLDKLDMLFTMVKIPSITLNKPAPQKNPVENEVELLTKAIDDKRLPHAVLKTLFFKRHPNDHLMYQIVLNRLVQNEKITKESDFFKPSSK